MSKTQLHPAIDCLRGTQAVGGSSRAISVCILTLSNDALYSDLPYVCTFGVFGVQRNVTLESGLAVMPLLRSCFISCGRAPIVGEVLR